MRTRERQDALMGWLRSRRSATAEEIADRFDVSLRTAHRDIAALRARDIPVEGDPGPGGGFRLDPLRHLPAVQLEVDEVVGLVLATTLASAAGTPFGTIARGAIAKILATLPPQRARELHRALDRVVVGPAASPAVVASLGPVEESVVHAFEAGFTTHRALAFEYLDRHGAPSTRCAEPHGLLAQPPAWYLLAWDLEREAPRMFRLDRMRATRLVGISFEPAAHRVFTPLLDEVGAWRVDSAPPR